MTFPSTVSEQMRSDWDRRAREDACYYATFGRLRQSQEEFFDSAADVLRILREEFRRSPPRHGFQTAFGAGDRLRPRSPDASTKRGIRPYLRCGCFR